LVQIPDLAQREDFLIWMETSVVVVVRSCEAGLSRGRDGDWRRFCVLPNQELRRCRSQESTLVLNCKVVASAEDIYNGLYSKGRGARAEEIMVVVAMH
jgi:hypothetical protein